MSLRTVFYRGLVTLNQVIAIVQRLYSEGNMVFSFIIFSADKGLPYSPLA